MAEAHIAALGFSVGRLRNVAAPMSESDLTASAYPAEWNIAQVLSHLGSAAVIMDRRLDDALASRSTPEDYAPRVWDTWNAKAPVAMRDDSLAADAALLARIQAVTDDERRDFAMAMGPLTLDFKDFIAMRLNEHALHTWDIEVVGDPAATLPLEVASLVVDNLELVARYTAKPTGDTATVSIITTQPERAFAVTLTPDAVAFAPSSDTDAPDLALSAEAFARLVYGRLDPGHTPPGQEAPALDLLRRAFPGP